MEEAHATHKDAAWGWFAVLISVLDGFPRSRSRPAKARRASAGVVTPWSARSPRGWSA